jgi:hypothetical protein
MKHAGHVLVAELAIAASPFFVVACSPQPATAAAPGSSLAASTLDAGASPEAAAPRPFASTAGEATTIIQNLIEDHMKPLWQCVDAFRAAKGDPHRALTIDVGTDQEGSLLGITAADPKQHDLDPTLKDCMWKVLHGLPFPRSHAGVITVRQNFTDATITQ